MLPLGQRNMGSLCMISNTSCETTIISLMSRGRVMAPRRSCSARSPQGAERELCLLARVSLLLFFSCFQDMDLCPPGLWCLHGLLWPGYSPPSEPESCERWGHIMVSRFLCALGHQALRSTNIRVTVPALWNWRWAALVFKCLFLLDINQEHDHSCRLEATSNFPCLLEGMVKY